MSGSGNVSGKGGEAGQDSARGGDSAISVVPANQATWDELQTVFGARGEAHRCQCQWFKTPAAEWHALGLEDRAERLRGQTGAG
ncbi:MAG TPA: hypothetical protein VH372_07575 [Actinospica sp.]|jgi:hypothetical protein|nr:hypothetical protein [Actinospica sp.]